MLNYKLKPMIDSEGEYFSIEELSKIYNINITTIRNWLRRKQLPYYKIGDLVRIKKEDWNKFVHKVSS